MRLAATEYARMADTLAALGPTTGPARRTAPAWDVRQLACHMVGMAAMVTTPLRCARQSAQGRRRRRGPGVDRLTALTALQVSERADWTTDEIVEGARKVGPAGGPRPAPHARASSGSGSFPTRSTSTAATSAGRSAS